MRRADIATGIMGTLLACLIASSQWLQLEPRADDPAILGWAADDRATSPDWSPVLVKLFRLSYLAASHSELDAYRISTSLLTIVLWLIIFAFLRVASGSRLSAFAAATIFIVSGFSPAAASRETQFIIASSISGHLALVFVLLAMLCVYLERSSRALALAAILLALAAYSRPEMLLAAIVGLSIVVWRATRECAWREPRMFMIALSPFVIWAILAWRWGIPMPSPARSWIAFGQHAGLSYCSVHPTKCHIDIWAGWQASVEQIFPGASSIGSAARLHPFTFTEHVVRNAVLSILNIITALFDFAGRPRSYAMIPFIALAGAGSFVLLRRVGRGDPMGHTSRPLLAIVLAAAAPPMANWMLLYPRQHYVIVPAVILSILASCYVFERSRKREGSYQPAHLPVA